MFSQFIQPPGEAPVRKLRLCVSNYNVRYLHAIMYYLHQHLQQIYNLPRFAENDSYNYFKNYPSRRTSWAAEPIDPSDTFLLNRYNSMSVGQTGNGKLFPTFLKSFYVTRLFQFPLKTSQN